MSAEGEIAMSEVCCHRCIAEGVKSPFFGMLTCPDCGNKRCPKATDHRLACTRSNESGQYGSIYGQTTPDYPRVRATTAPMRRKEAKDSGDARHCGGEDCDRFMCKCWCPKCVCVPKGGATENCEPSPEKEIGKAYDRLVSAVTGEECNGTYLFDTTEYEVQAKEQREAAVEAKKIVDAGVRYMEAYYRNQNHGAGEALAEIFAREELTKLLRDAGLL